MPAQKEPENGARRKAPEETTELRPPPKPGAQRARKKTGYLYFEKGGCLITPQQQHAHPADTGLRADSFTDALKVAKVAQRLIAPEESA